MLEHGYCRSLYTEDPNGLLLEFTADVDNADDIAAERRGDAHDTLKRWLDGDHTSNNTYRYAALRPPTSTSCSSTALTWLGGAGCW